MLVDNVDISQNLDSNELETNNNKDKDNEFEEFLQLDLEERRKRNIERNQKFFDQLFSTFSQTTDDPQSTPVSHQPLIIENNFIDSIEGLNSRNIDYQQRSNDFLNLFPSYRAQLTLISQYVDNILVTVSFLP
jgi:hypothetical protein